MKLRPALSLRHELDLEQALDVYDCRARALAGRLEGQLHAEKVSRRGRLARARAADVGGEAEALSPPSQRSSRACGERARERDRACGALVVAARALDATKRAGDLGGKGVGGRERKGEDSEDGGVLSLGGEVCAERRGFGPRPLLRRPGTTGRSIT